MNRLLLFTAAAVSVVTGSEAQQHPVALPHRPPVIRNSGLAATSVLNVRILALRVEFAADLDSRTSGNGKFMISGSPLQIDPPPHDSSYFASKLRFLENYFGRVSNGQLTIQADLFPSVVTLADSMAAYSPLAANGNRNLADLVIDSWTAASTASPGFPFSQYDSFILFHAGVGRDIDLVSILGFDPTPFDIPSVFLNLETLRSYLADPVFPGVSVGGGFHITNSMIVPETETRVFTSGSRTDTLQLGINGLLAASVGSYLGLPDLFDTRTGRSGIGQFGLMDGASIFALNGLFPPEPSAWEKIYLGWTVPIIVSAPNLSLTIPAVGLTQTGTDTIYKIPISATEYFLVENRSRDPLGNGQTLTLLQQGNIVTRHFGADTSGFVFYDLSGIAGALLDAEDFDWAMPGSTLDPGYEGGGILIWHIDETNLAQRIQSNTLNADPARRTVDLEEADGPQDIGQAYDFLDPGSGSENGWPLDFWFAGNSSGAYPGIFNESSFPASNSANGARTLITVSGFSARGPRMSVSVSQSSQLMTRLFRSARTIAGGGVIVTASDSGIFHASPGGVVALRLDGSSRTGTPDGLIEPGGSDFPVAVLDGPPTYVIGARDSMIFINELTDANADGIFDSNLLLTANFGVPVTCAPVLIDSLGSPRILAGLGDGRILTMRLDGTITQSEAVDTTAIRSIIWIPATAGSPLGTRVVSTETGLRSGPASVLLTARPDPSMLAGIRIGTQSFVSTPGGSGTLAMFDLQLVPQGSPLDLPGQPIDPAAGPPGTLIATDLDRDGNADILLSDGNRLLAFNQSGSLLDGFPVRFTDSVSAVLVADADGNGILDILVLSADGILHAVGSRGARTQGYPVQLSGPSPVSMALFTTAGGKTGIAVSSGDGGVDAWEINAGTGIPSGAWSQRFADHYNRGAVVVSTSGTQPLSQSFLPSDRVYNWPNPVYGNSTRIRYYTASEATVTVKIMTLAGALVTELSGHSPGGVDAEIAWDVRSIDSGIYFAQIEARGASRSETAVIKIAVVK